MLALDDGMTTKRSANILGNEGIDSVIQTLQELGALVDPSSLHQDSPSSEPDIAIDLELRLDPERLLQIEQKAAELQSTVHAFHQLQRQTTAALSTTKTSASASAEQSTSASTTNICKIHIHPHMILASRSQSAASRHRLFREKKVVAYIFGSLEEGLYANKVDALPEFAKQCQAVADWLHQSYNASIPTPTSDFLLESIKKEESETKSNNADHDPTIGTEFKSEEVQYVRQDANTKHLPFQLFSPTSGMYRLLMEGPEGTGKTHLLSHDIESLTGEGIQGAQNTVPGWRHTSTHTYRPYST
jgi:hypothetical protein